MPIKHQDFIIKGMHRDMTESAFNPEYAYENQNLRITTDPNAEGTRTGEMYAMTNERGNKYVPIYGLDSTGHNADGQYGDMNGVPIGQALLNNQWVVFMTDRDKQIFLNGTEEEIEDFPIEKTNIVWLKTDNLDRIYRLWFNNDIMNGELLYEGHLNFSVSFPLETLPYFENSSIQKVYWTDGLNQPRMINIVEKPEKKAHWNDYYFDFVSNIHFTHNVTVEESETGGRFPAGKIQWYFTYMMEFGPESNIFHSTPLYDIKFKDRGASPEEWTTQSFSIKLTNLDRQFDYVCVYSVIRTSLNNIPNCKLVAKLPITDVVTLVDTGIIGEAIEPQSLFYKGGEVINAYTFENKDNTLFLGNYTIMRSVIDEPTRLSLRAYALKSDIETAKGRCLKEVAQYPFSRFIYTDGEDAIGPVSTWFNGDWMDGVFNDLPNVEKFCTETSKHLPYFKKGNIYRIGIQFQHYTGKWSEVVWLGDYKNSNATYGKNDGWGGAYAARPLGYLKIDNQLQTIFDKLVSIGYRNVRPVVIYPNISERNILCEGFMSNTLMTNKNETKNYPDYFIRSYATSDLGTMAQFVGRSRFDVCMGVLGRSAMLFNRSAGNGYLYDESDYLRLFNVDNVCDIYSPDIELNDSMQVYNYNGCKIKIKDGLKISRVEYKRSLELKTINKSKIGYYNGDKFYFTSQQPFGYLGDENGHMYLSGNFRWQGCYLFDAALPNYKKEKNDDLEMEVPTKNATLVDYDKFILFPVNIWQHSGSVSFDTAAEPYNCTLKSNKTLHYIDSYHLDNNGYAGAEYEPQDMQIWNGGITGLKYYNSVGLYDGWVNLICNGFRPNNVGFGQRPQDGGYISWRSPDVQSRTNYLDSVTTPDYIDKLNSDDERNDYSTDDTQGEYPTCDIKYKTVPHLCARFGSATMDGNTGTVNINVSSSPMRLNLGNDCVPYIELTQSLQTESIFGGYTEEVLQRNSFIPCGDAYPIAEMYMEAMTDDPNAKLVEKYRAVDLAQHPIEIAWDTGDTYNYNYECLKTYPYTLEDENCVTEILKFPVETYVNLGGRYDRNMGNPNFGTLPSNWNLMNPIYNQTNNFMEYHGLDLSKNSVDDFHNSFTWTLTKWAGDETDRWTQITLANTMDVDGVRGGITKIINYGDMLMAFQPRGLSQILYNEREQLVTGSGVPVELSNSGKVAGTRYISNLAGCNNKWSICKTEQALYFVDDVNRQIMAFNGQLNNLSDNLGFHSWINVKANESIWNPLVFSNFISHFDPYNEDVMFYYKDNALSYSEQLQCFDSFFSYGYVPYYMAFHNSAFTLSDRDSDGKDTYRVWEQHKGYHNYFYVHDRTVYENGEVKLKGRLDNEDKPTYFGYEPYWTTLMVNPDMPYDKIFTNVDMRTDMWDWEGKLMEETFSHIEVWNEFQYNKSLLTKFTDIPKLHMPAKHSILKKKMRVWYIDIPRDSSDVQSHIWRGLKQNLPERNGLLCNRWKNRDRMRNTWLYLKLSKELYDEGLVEKTQWYKMPFRTDSKQVIHHIGVSYFI